MPILDNPSQKTDGTGTAPSPRTEACVPLTSEAEKGNYRHRCEILNRISANRTQPHGKQRATPTGGLSLPLEATFFLKISSCSSPR